MKFKDRVKNISREILGSLKSNLSVYIIKIILLIVSIVLIVQGCNCVNQAFDYKDNYYQSEDYPILNEHVYVGGDAYNYIINANYFTGYIVLGSGAFICSAIFIMSSLLIQKKHKRNFKK